MATQLQIRRGTAAQVAAFTGAEGEIVYNSTNDSLHTNDGATAGGFELARADLNNVSDADLNAALTGNTLSALTITTLTAGAATFSGNVGIGLVPTNFANRTSLDIGLGGKIWGHTAATETGHGSNFYFDGAYKRIAAVAPTRHVQDDNGHTFSVAASGAANSTITWNDAVTIDNSGKFLVGKTAAGFANTGHELRGGGSYAAFTRDGGSPVIVNRKGTDGTLVEYMKNGATVGSIGYNIGALTIDGGASRSGLYFGAGAILPRYNGGLVNGVNADLGATAQRFQDLYLSGTVDAGTAIFNGKLGIGTPTPAYQLTLSSNSAFWEAGLQTEVVGGNQVLKVVSDAFGGGGRTGSIEFHVNSVSASPAAKIDASGNLLVAKTTAGTVLTHGVELSSAGGVFSTTSDAGNSSYFVNLAATGTRYLQRFYASTTFVGSITSTGTATAYNTTSDYRLKEDDVPMTGATERVKALRPVNFAWKVDGSRTDGFFAHELAEVVPEAATGTKDAMRDEEYEVTPAVEEVRDEDGNVTTEAVAAVMGTRSVPDYQGIDQSKLVPLLTAALQEAIAKIEALTARIEALEGA